MGSLGAGERRSIEQQPFVREFVRTCDDAFRQGWHEMNGGNLSYRLTKEEATDCACEFTYNRAWVDLAVPVPAMAGEHLLITGSGKHMRNVKHDVASSIGIVEIGDGGTSYRVVWGLEGSKPSSEVSTHVACFAKRMAATNGACRVIYHAHPANIISMTAGVSLDDCEFTRVLWRSMAECIIAAPQGVGVISWCAPGSAQLAHKASAAMETYDAVALAQHGMFCAGQSLEQAFGVMHTLEKAAGIYLKTRAMMGGSDEFLNVIPIEGLREIAATYSLPVKEEFLEE